MYVPGSSICLYIFSREITFLLYHFEYLYIGSLGHFEILIWRYSKLRIDELEIGE